MSIYLYFHKTEEINIVETKRLSRDFVYNFRQVFINTEFSEQLKMSFSHEEKISYDMDVTVKLYALLLTQ